MRLDARINASYGWKVFDAATGAEVKNVVWVDDERKELGRYDPDDNWRIVTERMRAIHIDVQSKTVKLYRIG